MDRASADALDPLDRIALIELQERDGRITRVIDVHGWPLTIGRALANHIVIDDPYIAAQHARLTQDADGRILLSVLDPRNGVSIDSRRVDAARPLRLPAAGAVLQMGATRVRLRLPAEVLAPQKPLPGLTRGQALRPLLAGAGLMALEAAGQWLSLDPGADYAAWLPTLVGLPLALAAWSGLWALLSKLFQHRFDFSGHLHIALPWLLAISLAGMLLPQIAAALDAPWLWQLAAPLQAVLAALLLRAHLNHALPNHTRAVGGAVAACLLVGSGISLLSAQRTSDSLRSAPYMSTLPTPALRLAGSVPSAKLVEQMGPLAGRLAQRAKKARDEDPGESTPDE